MRDYVVLYINGRRTEVRGKHVFASLSDFLRYELGQTGTKVVCAEGDCGSCSVLLGRVIDNHPEYSPVCSCIQYLYQLDAAHVVTIEGLTCNHDPNRSMGVSPMSSGQGMDETSTLREAAALNPVQRAMVQCQGAQCGYCTPGFVVAMHDLFDDGQPKEEPAIRRALTGNLCRCTGYEPILQAASQVDASKIRRISDLYPTQEIAAELTELSKDDVRVADGDRIFFKPTHARDAAKFRGEHPNCTIITGGTDIGVQVNKGIRQISAVLDTHGLHALRKIQGTGDHLLVGAGATLSELEESCKPHFPELARLLEYFGSPLIRNAGTLAGNLANGSPIGDTLPPLFVMNAEIELTNPTASRWVNINSFYTGYRKTVMAADEIITAVRIPLPKRDEIVRFYKVSKRKDLDISSFTAAIWMRLNGKLIHEIRIAFGGVGPVVLRLPKTESTLTNQLFTEDAMWQAGEIALAEITPISDVRGSADYRNRLAANILPKFYHDVIDRGGNGHATPTPAGNGGVHA